jgi:SAM-dependent methyltransferase
MFTEVQYRLLKRISSGGDILLGDVYADRSKLRTHFGNEFIDAVKGKTVIDFGCGTGVESVEMAQSGALQVIGIDIRQEVLAAASKQAHNAGVKNCIFTTETHERADIIVSMDAFEHFSDPAAILNIMDCLLKLDGCAYVSFGPTWYHPLGGHLFSVFPWAHLLFSEKALIRWRSTFKSDGATRFGEVAGGLNQMTIARFEKLVACSPFKFASFEAVPIRLLRPFHNRATREFTTAVVHCRLVKR